jgi:SAM-dependent methyltransferase
MPRRRKRRTAANSDRHRLYELSVQDPAADCDFLDQVWLDLRGRKARSLREDFCGTAILAIEWVRRSTRNTAIGVDLDAAVLEQAAVRVRRRLRPAQRRRIELLRADVVRVRTRPVDTVVAGNFSYFVFKTRPALRRYFRNARRALADGGLLVLDAYGGSDAFREVRETSRMDGFTYVWDQRHYNPVTGDALNHIHFRFPDGSALRKAFTYDWRLWTLPELREVLEEAGFRDVTVYWEGTDEETGEGDGVWSVTTKGEACEGWIAYLVARK